VRLSSRVRTEPDSPIALAHDLAGSRSGRRPLLDLAQAAPGHPPAPSVVDRVVTAARHPRGAAYVGEAGWGPLREAFADELSAAYRGCVHTDDVVVTAGCNQAFCLVTDALAEPGDEIVLAVPYYFNHAMWLRMRGIRVVHLEPGADLLPDPDAAAALLTERTRAIVVVTPGNPTGVTVPPDTLTDLAALARRRGIALVVDETYRSFRDTDDPPHALFADPDWRDTVISLHSFSKDLAIPGYRVGAVVSGPAVTTEVLKLLDCVAIGAPRIGQEAALAGLTTAGPWRAERAADLADRRRGVVAALADRPGGFTLLSCGGYFAWARHPWPDRPTADVVRRLVVEQDLLVVPGTAFEPGDRGTIRLSVGPLDAAGTDDLVQRLVAAG
jgi:aspartate/methionine/tyrosine aminotransferase